MNTKQQQASLETSGFSQVTIESGRRYFLALAQYEQTEPARQERLRQLGVVRDGNSKRKD